MLIASRTIAASAIITADSELDFVKDFFFSDDTWRIRYFIVDTGNWLPGQRVLISPSCVRVKSWITRRLECQITQEQIKSGPTLDEHKPVSRQHEVHLADYFDWPRYWFVETAGSRGPTKEQQRTESSGDNHGSNLRSGQEVLGYQIEASDGEIGHVDDLIIDDDNWQIRYFVVDTGNWLPGRQVLISPDWAESIRWPDRTVTMAITRDDVDNSPQFDPQKPVNREFEEILLDFYGRPKYWA